MKNVPPRRLRTENPAEDRAREALATDLREIAACPLLRGRLITEVRILATDLTTVEHKLGRTPIGWIVVRKRLSTASIAEGGLDDRFIKFAADSLVVADFWVF